MNVKSTIVLLIVAAALLVAAWWYSKREESITREAQAPRREVVAGITSTTVERIEITPPSDTSVTLTKREGTWYTDPAKKHTADRNLINSMFAALERKIEGDVVSLNPDSFGEYQVNETSGTHVQIYGSGGKLIEDLYVGKAGPNYFTTYLREADAKEVVNANAALSYTFNKPEGWRDKSIFDFKAESIVGIDSEGTSGSFALRKSGDTWRVERPVEREAQTNKLQPITTALGGLRTMEFVDMDSTTTKLADLGLDPPNQKITLTVAPDATESTRTVTLLLGNKKSAGGSYYAKLLNKNDVYTVAEYQARNLTPKPEELAVAPPPPPAEAQTTATAAVEKPAVPADWAAAGTGTTTPAKTLIVPPDAASPAATPATAVELTTHPEAPKP